MAVDAGTIYAAFELDTSGFDSSMNHAASSLSGFAGGEAAGSFGVLDTAIGKIGATIAGLKIGEKLVEIGQSVVTTGMDFDSQMSRVQAISGATEEDFIRLRDAAIQMGADSVFGATDAAQAMEYMGMAGWKADQMIEGLPGIMNLAAASGESLGSVSDIVTDALTAFGLKASDSAHFADILAAASSNSNTNVGLMGETFKYVAPLAGALGFSAEDTAVAIGLMANAGIKGSQAGTALRAALSSMTNPSDAAATAMDALGLSMTDSGGEMKSLDTLMGDLRTSFAGLTEAEQVQYAATIFGQEAMSGMLAIINASEEDFGKLTTAIEESGGATERMSSQMLDNLAGDMEGFKGALETAALSIYDKFEPALRSGVQAATGLVDAFNAEGITGVFNTIVEAAQSIEWPGIATTIMDGVTGVLGKAGDFLLGLFSSGKEAAQELPWDEVGTAVQGGVNCVVDTGGAFLSSAFTAAKTTIEGISWGDVGSKISSGLSGALDTLGKIGSNIWDTITGWFSDDDEESAQSDAEAMMDGLETGITGGAGAVAAAASSAASGVSTAMTNVLNLEGGTAIAASWMNGLSSDITAAQATLTTNAQTVADATKLVMDTTFSAANGTTIGTVFMAGISSGFTTSSPTLSSNATTVAAAASYAASQEMSFGTGNGIGMNMVLGMAAGVRSGSSSLNSAIRSVARSAVAAARSTLKINSPSGTFEEDVGAWIPSGIGVGVTKNMQDVLGPIEEMRDGMVSMMDGTLSGISLGRPKAPWDSGGYAGQNTININITGDWSVRSDEDRREIINELSAMIDEELRRR